MARFIKLNHGVIDINTIIGVGDIFWSDVEVKPKKTTTKKNTLGLAKNKTKRGWGFNVITFNHKITIFPTTSPFNYSSNTRSLALQKHKEILSKLKYEEEDNKANTG